MHHTLHIVWHSVCRHRNYETLENVCIALYSAHTSRRGSGSTRPTPSSDSCCTLGVAVQVHVMAATQTVNQLLPLIIISTANLYAYNIITKHILDYGNFENASAGPVQVFHGGNINTLQCPYKMSHSKRNTPPFSDKTTLPSRAIASIEIVKWLQSKCNSCCI